MSDEHTTNDSTDTGTDSRPARADPSIDRHGSPAGVGRRGFLQAMAASLGGLTAVDSLSEAASAAGSTRKHLLVVGRGSGRHSYEIRMESGTIRKATYADPGDRATDTDAQPGNDRIEGGLWHWNIDSYAYTGEIGAVEGNGTLSVHFLDGAFRDHHTTMVRGQGQGRHEYTMATHSGDIDLNVLYTGNGDEDEGTGDSEHSGSPDWVTGYILGKNKDGYFTDTPIQFLRIDDGHLIFEEEE